jgi:hypothetical protein
MLNPISPLPDQLKCIVVESVPTPRAYATPVKPPHPSRKLELQPLCDFSSSKCSSISRSHKKISKGKTHRKYPGTPLSTASTEHSTPVKDHSNILNQPAGDIEMVASPENSTYRKLLFEEVAPPQPPRTIPTSSQGDRFIPRRLVECVDT